MGLGIVKMRSFIASLLLCCLTACAPYDTAVMTTPENVRAYANACAAPPQNLRADGFVYAGFDFVDQECQNFFDNIVLLQKQARYSSSMIATGNSTTAAILALVKASAVSIAIVASGTEFARTVIEGYAAEFAFAPYALEARAAVFDAMSLYRNDPQGNGGGEGAGSQSTPAGWGTGYGLPNFRVGN